MGAGSLISALSARVHNAVRWVASACIVVMLLAMVVQILARYGFNAPPIWTEEVARYMMVWAGLLSATMSFRNRADAVLLDSVLPPSLEWVARAVQTLAVLVFLLPVLYFCFFNWNGAWGQGFMGRSGRLTADTLGMSMVWVTMAVPICASVILIHLLARWFDPDPVAQTAQLAGATSTASTEAS